MHVYLNPYTFVIIQPLCSGHLESVKWLVANRANLDAKDFMGRVPLDLAMDRQQDEVSRFLRACEEDKSNPNSSLAQLRSRSPSLTRSV